MNVLIADDDLVSSRIVSKTLSKEKDATITEASSTEKALELLDGGLLPDLIILDLVFPGMSGEDFLQKIRTTPRWKNIPVIVSSYTSARNLIERVARLGVSGYLLKPVEIGRLRTQYREIARKCASRIPLEPASTVTERLEISESDYHELLELYSVESGRMIVEIKKSAEADENQQLEVLLETLRATSANIGALAIKETAARIIGAIDAPDTVKLTEFIQQLEAEKLRTDQEITSRCPQKTPA